MADGVFESLASMKETLALNSQSFLKTRRVREFLEQARSRRIFQHPKVYRRRELDFLDLLIKLTGFFLAIHAILRLVTIGAAVAFIPLVICLPMLACAYVCFRTQRYQCATESLLLTSVLAYVSHNAFGGTFANLDELGYLLVPLVIGVLLLSSRSLVILVAVDFGVVIAVGLLTFTGGSAAVLVSMLIGIAFASTLALVVKRYLHQVDSDRRVEMAENESIFHSLITNMPVFLVVLDRDGIITLVEGRALEAVPFEPGNFIGRSVYDAYQDFPQIVDDCRRALNGEILNSSVEFGSMVLDVWYSPLMIDEGERSGVIAIATDVTERQRAEEVLQQQASLLQSVSDAIISVDLDFNIQTWNRAAEEMFGSESFDVIGRPMTEIITSDRPAGWEAEALARTEAEGEWEVELNHRQKDGMEICVLASFAPLENDAGETSGMIIVARDITQRKNAEQQSLDLALEREKVKLLRDFIGDSSHDFRTPLTTIRTSAYLLRVKHPDITTKHLDVIESEVDHLGRLVEDLLTLARLDTAPVFEFASVDITALIQRTIVPLQLLAHDKQQTLAYRSDRRPLLVRGDAIELARVLVNVLTNAINYTRPSGEINVVTINNDKTVTIQITDNGLGISEDDLPHVFERFYRVDKTRASKTGGAGLGLPIAKKIVEAHGGSITVESTLGVGSSFMICLPLI